MRIHPENAYRCSDCGRGFCSKRDRLAHGLRMGHMGHEMEGGNSVLEDMPNQTGAEASSPPREKDKESDEET